MLMTDVEITNAAARYMGHWALWTVVLAFGAVGLWVLLFLGVVNGHLSVWLALPLASYLIYTTYTPLHEAVHNNISGRNTRLRWLNELTGYIVANMLGISFTMHKAAHLAHHRHTNIAGKDPDLVYSGNEPYDALTGGVKLVVNEYRDYFQRVFPHASKQERAIVIAELLVAVGWRLGLGLAFPMEVVVLALIANLLGVTFLVYMFAWIVHAPFDQTERFKDTVTILLPAWIHKPATWFWLWQNYHSIHHLYPRVPFYLYAKLFEEIRDGMYERGAPIISLTSRGREFVNTPA